MRNLSAAHAGPKGELGIWREPCLGHSKTQRLGLVFFSSMPPGLPCVLRVFSLHVRIAVITGAEPLTVHSVAIPGHINDLILGIDAAIQAIARADFQDFPFLHIAP